MPAGPASHHTQECLLAALVSSCPPLWETRRSAVEGGIRNESCLHTLAPDTVPCPPVKGAPVERGRNHTISSRVCRASCAFKNAEPFGYERLCVRACVCVCASVCIRSRQSPERFLVLCRGILKCSPSLPWLLSSCCSSRTFQHLLTMLSAAGRSPVCRKSGWSLAEGGLDLIGGC